MTLEERIRGRLLSDGQPALPAVSRAKDFNAKRE